MNGDPNTPEPSARDLLREAASAVSACTPEDRDALRQLHSKLSLARASLERAGIPHDLAPMAWAEALTEVLARDGVLDTHTALSFIPGIVERALAALPAEKTAASSATQKPAGALPAKPLEIISQRRLGEIMVKLAMLAPSQVEKALQYQRDHRCHFGEALVRLGFVSDEAVRTALRAQRAREYDSSDPWRHG